MISSNTGSRVIDEKKERENKWKNDHKWRKRKIWKRKDVLIIVNIFTNKKEKREKCDSFLWGKKGIIKAEKKGKKDKYK